MSRGNLRAAAEDKQQSSPRGLEISWMPILRDYIATDKMNLGSLSCILKLFFILPTFWLLHLMLFFFFLGGLCIVCTLLQNSLKVQKIVLILEFGNGSVCLGTRFYSQRPSWVIFPRSTLGREMVFKGKRGNFPTFEEAIELQQNSFN